MDDQICKNCKFYAPNQLHNDIGFCTVLGEDVCWLGLCNEHSDIYEGFELE